MKLRKQSKAEIKTKLKKNCDKTQNYNCDKTQN